LVTFPSELEYLPHLSSYAVHRTWLTEVLCTVRDNGINLYPKHTAIPDRHTLYMNAIFSVAVNRNILQHFATRAETISPPPVHTQLT